MKLRSPRILAPALLGIARCFGGAPESLAGYVFNETGYTFARTSFQYAVVLNSTGTFQGLYFKTTTLAFGRPPIVQDPQDGTWSYRKLNENTAELTLRSPGGGTPPDGQYLLSFTSDSEGSVVPSSLPPGILSISFRVAPLSEHAPLVNCSNRSFVRTNSSAFTGFVIGNSVRTVLVRAIGPTLSAFGVEGALRNPALSVVSATTNAVVGANDDWSSESARALSRAAAVVGAFPLPENSADAAVILSLPPGAYIAQVTSSDKTDSGEALIEVYLFP